MPQPEDQVPDYRFSLANERTFLAWIRTALALIAGGLAVAAFLPAAWPTGLRHSLAVVLVLAGAALSIRALDRWACVEVAMRRDEALPPTRFPAVLAVVIALGAVALAVVVLAIP